MKILKKTILLVMFSLLLSNLCIAQEAEEHFKRGVGYFETRLINEAIAEFKKALPLFKEQEVTKKQTVDRDDRRAVDDDCRVVYSVLIVVCYDWGAVYDDLEFVEDT